tara:strand:+ start:439 stop:942 length:504 start_codon:yes stop_codon:yes gene_type:complete
MDLNKIKQEISNWVKDYLDVPNEYYNGLKPCPFAHKAWFGDKTKTILGDKQTVLENVTFFDRSKDLAIIVYDPKIEKDMDKWAESLNKAIEFTDLYLIVFNPEDEPDDPRLHEEAYESVVDYAYGAVFIQPLSELKKASNLLNRQGYYKNLSTQFMSYVNKRNNNNG